MRVYPSEKDRKHLAATFHLPYESSMQDWEIEVADPQKIHQFVTYFLHENLTNGQAISLTAIIFQSLEELLIDGKLQLANDSFKQLLPALQRHKETLGDVVDYWKNSGFELSKLLIRAAD